MDSLFVKADAIQPLTKKSKSKHDKKPGKKTSSDVRKSNPVNPKSTSKSKPGAGPSSSSSVDRTLASVAQNAALPRSLRSTSPVPDNVPKHSHIEDLKLRAELNRQAAHVARTKVLLQDAELLLTGDAGAVQAESEMERTWRVSQDEIAREAGQEAAKGRQEWTLDGGPYRARYSRNGRFVVPCFYRVCATPPVTLVVSDTVS